MHVLSLGVDRMVKWILSDVWGTRDKEVANRMILSLDRDKKLILKHLYLK
jgi:hypothetical protein